MFSKDTGNYLDISDAEDEPDEEEDDDAIHEEISGQETSAMDICFDFGEPVAGDGQNDDDNVEY